MRTQWSRKTAIIGLLIALLSDLRRRAWWLGRHTAVATPLHAETLVAPRPVDQTGLIPQVGSLWRPVAECALPVGSIVMVDGPDDHLLPMIVVDVADHPEIADLPRVLAAEVHSESQVIVGANWLADPVLSQAVLVVTFVEPVTCTWAISFDLPRCLTGLEYIARGYEFLVVWYPDEAPEFPSEELSGASRDAAEPRGLLLRVGRPDHLRAILNGWLAEHETT